MISLKLFVFVICLAYMNLVISQNLDFQLYDLAQVKPIELAAVGRVAELGELYDARSGQFLHLSLIKKNLASSIITSTQNKHTKLSYTMVNSLEEKFRTLDISAELKLSIMGGLISLEGSGKYFKDTKTSAKSAKASLLSSFSTEYEQFSITGSEVRSLIDLDALEQIDATHVVVGIQWGGNVFISVEDTNIEDRDQQTVEGSLKAKLTYLATQISGQADVKFDEKEKNELSKFNFEIYGDLLPETTPQTLIDAIIFMKSAPKLLLEGNKGKGKAMKYTLIPISLLRQILKISAKINTISNEVDSSTVDSCTKLFDDLNLVEQKLNDIIEYVNKFDKFIIDTKINEVKILLENFKVFQSAVVTNLSNHLVLVRAGNETIDKLRAALSDAYKNPYSFGNINLDKFIDLKREFKFLKLLQDLNVVILDKETTIQDYLSSNFNKDIYIFFYKEEFPDLNENAMLSFRKVLENKAKFGQSAIFSSVKFDILDAKEAKEYFNFPGSTKLSMFRNGKKIIDNFDVDTKIPPDNNPELWSFYYMQTQVYNLLKNPVPIGFIYAQLPQQPEPHNLWPSVKWSEVTSQYAGLFFRAAGGDAATFGTEQEADSPRLSSVATGYPNGDPYGNIYTKPGTWSDLVGSGGTQNGWTALKFYVTKCEVRPRNKAIKIWKRI